MPAVVGCPTCQTKLKVPDGTTAKALRCPKCKGIVPLAATASPAAPPAAKPATPKPAAPVSAAPKPAVPKAAPKPPPQDDEEFVVNDAVDEEEEEFVVDEAVDATPRKEPVFDEDSALAQLGFLNIDDPFAQAEVGKKHRKLIESKFVGKEKVYWVGRPSQRVIESQAGLNVIIGIVCIVVGLGIASLSFLIPSFPPDVPVPSWLPKAILIPFGGIFAALGLYMILRRKTAGGSVEVAYVVTNKHAYICDLAKDDVRIIAPAKIGDLEVKESKIEDAGHLVLFYELDAYGTGTGGGVTFGTGGDAYQQAQIPVGFMNIEQVQLVKTMVREVLVDALEDKAKAKKKKKEQEKKEKREEKRKSRRPW
jgi:hypothetical protein